MPVRHLLNTDIHACKGPAPSTLEPSRASAWCTLSDKHADAVQGRLLHHPVLTFLLVAQVHHRKMEDVVDISMDSPEGAHSPHLLHTLRSLAALLNLWNSIQVVSLMNSVLFCV